MLEQHLALAKKMKNPKEELLSLRLAAQAYQGKEDFRQAQIFYQEAIALAGALGDSQEVALLRNDLAQILYYQR